MRLLLTLALTAALAGQAGPALFDAVSIKVATERRGAPPDPPARYTRNGVRLDELLRDAFGYPAIRFVGVPDWGRTINFEVVARASRALTPAETRQALQQMLAERFSLRTHTESREMAFFALIAPNGDTKFPPRLSRTKEDCAAIRADRSRRGDVGLSIPRTPGAEKPVCGTFFYNLARADGQRSIRYMTGGTTLQQFADFLGGPAQRVVVDRTGLAGEFDIDIEFATLNGAAADNTPSLTAAVDEQLGLKLQPQRGPIDVVVVDAVTQPSGN